MSYIHYSVQSGIKIVPSNIEGLLTKVGLAYWIQDDGNFNKKTKQVILCSFFYKSRS
jgi:LAGLIDADG DNA endonuclease family